MLKRAFTNPVILTLMVAEFCTGFVRQGLMLWFTPFLKEIHHIAPGSGLHQVASLGITVGGIVGGLLCGYMSDRLFQSRRPPVAFIFYIGQIISLLILGAARVPGLAAFMIGFCCMWIFGVHGMLSGTASMDFGGTRGAATVTGLLDGVQYLASGLTGFGMGYFLDRFGWGVWVYLIIPFSVIGAVLMLTLWNQTPRPQPRADAEERALRMPCAAVVDRSLLFFCTSSRTSDGFGAQEFRLDAVMPRFFSSPGQSPGSGPSSKPRMAVTSAAVARVGQARDPRPQDGAQAHQAGLGAGHQFAAGLRRCAQVVGFQLLLGEGDGHDLGVGRRAVQRLDAVDAGAQQPPRFALEYRGGERPAALVFHVAAATGRSPSACAASGSGRSRALPANILFSHAGKLRVTEVGYFIE